MLAPNKDINGVLVVVEKCKLVGCATFPWSSVYSNMNNKIKTNTMYIQVPKSRVRYSLWVGNIFNMTTYCNKLKAREYL